MTALVSLCRTARACVRTAEERMRATAGAPRPQCNGRATRACMMHVWWWEGEWKEGKEIRSGRRALVRLVEEAKGEGEEGEKKERKGHTGVQAAHQSLCPQTTSRP